MDKGIQTSMAQGWLTKIIWMIEWMRAIRLSMKNSLSLFRGPAINMVVSAQGGNRLNLKQSSRRFWSL